MANNSVRGITIEIGASTQGLTQALSEVNQSSKNISKELSQVNKLLKFSPKDTELLGQKQKLLSDQIATTKEKLDKLREAQSQVNEQFKNGEISEEQYRGFQREVVETTSKLKNYEDQLKATNEQNNTFAQKLDELSTKFQTAGQKMQDVGGTLTKGVTVPIAAIGAASTVAFNEVDGALDTIATKTGATGEAMAGLGTSFENVAKTMPVDLQSVGDAVGEVNTQFGLTGQSLEQASTQMLKFAEINNADVTASTQNAKGAMEAFGLSSQNLNGVLDAVTATAQNTGVSADTLFASVTKGAPQLQALGLNFSQSAEMMGSFEQKGIDSSKALSYLSKAQVTFAKDGQTLSEGLGGLIEKIQNSSSETEALSLASEYFGTKGAPFMLDAINRGALDFDDFKGAAENASGAVSNTFEETLDPIDKNKVAMNNLKLAGSELSSAIQNTLAPMIEKATGGIQKFTEWFKNLSPQMQETIVKIGMVAAAIGPLLVVGGKLSSGIGDIMGLGKKLAPVIGGISPQMLLVGGAITAVIAIGVLLYKNWDTIKAKAGELKTAVVGKFNDIKEGIVDKINSAKEGVSTAIEKIKGFFNFKWELPKIKLPHFKISGKFSLNPPQIPHFSVDWYKQGGIFNTPSIIGVGEAGQEAVLPIEKLSGIMTDALKKINKSNVSSGQQYIRQQALPPGPQTSGERVVQVHVHVGTLIADKFGLKQLERELRGIRIEEDARSGEVRIQV